MTILKQSSSSSKQNRNKAPKKCRSSSSNKRTLPQIQKVVMWNDEETSFHDSGVDEPDLYHRRHEIWYSREDYQQFHVDRIKTIEGLRANGIQSLDKEAHCCRGLEPFWTIHNHRELQSGRRIYKSTIMLEQARQNLTQVKDVERFRIMVLQQSELSQKRAHELAALDQLEARQIHAIYAPPQLLQVNRHAMQRKETDGMINVSPKSAMSFVPQSAAATLATLSLSGSQQIRALQEVNARRLMQMYSGNNGAAPAFRFPIRRDSLVGGARFIRAMMIAQQNGV